MEVPLTYYIMSFFVCFKKCFKRCWYTQNTNKVCKLRVEDRAFYLRSCVITNRCNSPEKSHNLNSVEYSIGIERKDSMRVSGR